MLFLNSLNKLDNNELLGAKHIEGDVTNYKTCLDIIESETEYSVNIIAELCARFGKTLTYLELFKRLEMIL